MSPAELETPDELDAVKVRSKDVGQDVAKARELVQGVAREFRRIERECVVNQLDDRNVADMGKIANRLDRVLGDNPQSVSPEEDEQVRDGRLAPEATFPQAWAGRSNRRSPRLTKSS